MLCGGELQGECVLKSADDGKPYGLGTPLIEHHFDGDTAKANARLIAAAPKLFEELKKALVAMEQDWHTIDDEWGSTMQGFGDLEGAIRQRHKSTDAIRSARAAIAEAEGME
jgi:hypothetical protein